MSAFLSISSCWCINFFNSASARSARHSSWSAKFPSAEILTLDSGITGWRGWTRELFRDLTGDERQFCWASQCCCCCCCCLEEGGDDSSRSESSECCRLSFLSPSLDFRTPAGTGSITTPLKARLAPNKLSKSSLLEVFDEEDASAAFDLKSNKFFRSLSVYIRVSQ